jgi:hypothetical protein
MGLQMKLIQNGELENNIESAFVQYLDTGVKELLSTKSGSRCHFFDPIFLNDNKVLLRLDWAILIPMATQLLMLIFTKHRPDKSVLFLE